MMTIESFQYLIEALKKENALDDATASQYAYLIGDTPEYDDDGNLVVRENGVEIARVKLTDECDD